MLQCIVVTTSLKMTLMCGCVDQKMEYENEPFVPVPFDPWPPNVVVYDDGS
jgi:hypothetical protein